MELSLEETDFLVGLVEGFLEESNVLLVFFALDHDLLDGALLLTEDLDGLSVTPLLFIEFEFHVTDAGLELADDALASNDGVGFDFLETDRQVLDFDFERLLDGFDLHYTLLLFVEDLHSVLDFSLEKNTAQ